MDEKMVVDQSKHGAWDILQVSGRMDTITAPQLEQLGMEALVGSQQLALELTALEYISSAGLRVLLRLAKRARQEKKRFALVGIQGLVKEIMEDSGMDVLFVCHSSLDELEG